MGSVSSEKTGKVTGIAFLLFCLSLFITAYSARNPRSSALGSALISEAQRPVSSAVGGITGFFSDTWNNYFALVGVREEYDRLYERTRALEQDKSRLLELEQENLRLTKLLNAVPEGSSGKGIAARVVGYDASNWTQVVTIDRGSNDGIVPNMAVITAEGVVGQIIATSFTVSRVLLITDHSSGVDALIQGSRARGIVEGVSRKSLRWKFILDAEEIKIGDRLVTSGLDGIFPSGLFIGRIATIDRDDGGLFLDIGVTPAVPFAKLESVVVLPLEPSTVLVPTPTATPKSGGKK